MGCVADLVVAREGEGSASDRRGVATASSLGIGRPARSMVRQMADVRLALRDDACYMVDHVARDFGLPLYLAIGVASAGFVLFGLALVTDS